jgi:hypothetical protein
MSERLHPSQNTLKTKRKHQGIHSSRTVDRCKHSRSLNGGGGKRMQNASREIMEKGLKTVLQRNLEVFASTMLTKCK